MARLIEEVERRVLSLTPIFWRCEVGEKNLPRTFVTIARELKGLLQLAIAV